MNSTTRRVLPLIAVLTLAGCGNGSSPASDAGPDADTGDPIPLTAVDLLIAVDDSNGMAQEQFLLSSQLFAFVGALMHPLPASTYAAVDDIRIAVVTSNMGFSSDGVNNDEYWPDPDAVPSQCAGFGDDGRFQTSMPSIIELPNDTIPCDATDAQCPGGWTCIIDGDAGVDGAGVCHTDGTTSVSCPELEDASWAKTTPDAPNGGLTAQAACLANQGNSGCGWEQQLASPARALVREDQTDFVRDNAVLAVVLVSEEEDCSMKDGESMFEEEEVAEPSLQEIGLACGNHPEHLVAPSHFYEVFTGAKPSPDAVVYAAIVGVPYGEQPGAAACQGPGDQIGDCLDQEAMQLLPEQPGGGDAWWFHPACIAIAGSTEITRADPGRRYVELATDFGANGYVYSICNADWSPAFAVINMMIAEKLE